MKTDEKIMQYIQEFFLDKGIKVEGDLEQAIYQSLRKALKGVRIDGEAEDIEEFKSKLPKFAEMFNCKVEG